MIKVLVVDDSSTVRTALKTILEEDSEIKVVGFATNGVEAIELAEILQPDVVILDVEMPVMNGVEALENIKDVCPLCMVIMFSSLTEEGAEITFEALKKGAADFITKPKNFMDLFKIKKELQLKIKSLIRNKVEIPPSKTEVKLNLNNTPLIGIGASTGGPQVITDILNGLKKGFKSPILIAIHMPESFTKIFAKRLDKGSNLTVKEAESGEIIEEGVAYISKGGKNMVVIENRRKKIIMFKNKKTKFVPSVDLLFSSIADTAKKNSIGIILSGMGDDGSEGIIKIKEAGGINIAQNPNSCVLPSMPENAIKTNKVDLILDPKEIIDFLNNSLGVKY
ncbi:chemotaxis-specific protein-glutamate methyltransferase CheB [Persephonella sp.]